MILVIDAINRYRFPKILDDMFELRARVFHDRLGWDVNVRDGQERDKFDDLDPAYVVALDDDYNVVGCNRMLQTTGPHMLADVFQNILKGEPPLRSATVWENTRFCVDKERLSQATSGPSVTHVACELMIGLTEYALDSGLSDVINVIDPAMDRVLKRCGNAPYGYLGEAAQFGKTKALAALGDITEERIERIRAIAGITGDVFADEDAVADALEKRVKGQVTQDDLEKYCDEQIEAAATVEERVAAMRLKAALTEHIYARRHVTH